MSPFASRDLERRPMHLLLASLLGSSLAAGAALGASGSGNAVDLQCVVSKARAGWVQFPSVSTRALPSCDFGYEARDDRTCTLMPEARFIEQYLKRARVVPPPECVSQVRDAISVEVWFDEVVE